VCASRLILFFLTTRRPPTSPLFPYTTLFRSLQAAVGGKPGALGQPGRPARDERARQRRRVLGRRGEHPGVVIGRHDGRGGDRVRSEEHTSELQSLTNLVCRLLLEKKK